MLPKACNPLKGEIQLLLLSESDFYDLITEQFAPSDQEPSGSPTPKRSRGRPKGSKNKTTAKSKVSAWRGFVTHNCLLMEVPTGGNLALKGCPVAGSYTAKLGCFLSWGSEIG